MKHGGLSVLVLGTTMLLAGCAPTASVPVGDAPVVEPSVESLMAYTFDDAAALCELTFTGQELEDCIDGALISFCEFEPFLPGEEFYDPEIDGPCLAQQAQDGAL